MISIRKQELVKNAKDLFGRGNKKAADPQAVIDNLQRYNPPNLGKSKPSLRHRPLSLFHTGGCPNYRDLRSERTVKTM
jgi:hypothetical protein